MESVLLAQPRPPMAMCQGNLCVLPAMRRAAAGVDGAGGDNELDQAAAGDESASDDAAPGALLFCTALVPPPAAATSGVVGPGAAPQQQQQHQQQPGASAVLQRTAVFAPGLGLDAFITAVVAGMSDSGAALGADQLSASAALGIAAKLTSAMHEAGPAFSSGVRQRPARLSGNSPSFLAPLLAAKADPRCSHCLQKPLTTFAPRWRVWCAASWRPLGIQVGRGGVRVCVCVSCDARWGIRARRGSSCAASHASPPTTPATPTSGRAHLSHPPHGCWA